MDLMLKQNRIKKGRCMYHIIVNPIAGNGNGLEVYNEVALYLAENNIKYKPYISEFEEQTTALTQMALAEGAKMLIVIGGDESFAEVVSAIGEREVAVGLIPAGKENNFAYSANIPLDPILALEGILKKEATEIDTIDCNGVKCLGVCDCGFNATAMQKLSKCDKKGKFSYIKCLFKALFSGNTQRLKINIDNLQSIEDDYAYVGCCNAKRTKFGVPVCSSATLEDGLLNLVVFKKVSKWQAPFVAISFLLGKHLNKKWCVHIPCKYAKITSVNEEPLLINLDGELYSAKELVARVDPCGLLCLNQ